MSELEERFAIQIALCSLPEPEREYRFAAVHVGLGPGVRGRLTEAGLRDWRFDFAWPAHMLAVEVEGGTWVQGRHSRGAGYRSDCEKYNAATAMGWRVYRFTSGMFCDGEAIDTLILIFREATNDLP